MSEIQQRYVLLPEKGVVATAGLEAQLMTALPRVRSTEDPTRALLESAGDNEVHIVDSTRENGPKLVETTAAGAAAVNDSDAPLRMLPVIEYPLPTEPMQVFSDTTPAAALTSFVIVCVDGKTSNPVAGAKVVAYTDFAQKIGAEGVSDAAGRATLSLPGSSIERLLVAPPLSGYWGALLLNVVAIGEVTVKMTPIDLSFTDSVRHYYAASKFDPAAGVQVGVIDTGAGPHSDLNVVSAVNTVTGEPPQDAADSRGHGTHVAGLIGSNGTPPAGLRGLAPGVALRAYRVFPRAAGGASNYSILKAMILAAGDGCDVVNLSLSGRMLDDPVVKEAVVDARNAGMLVMAAAGNDYRSPVGFPAAHPLVTAVSALGREGTFPPGSQEQGKVLRPPSGQDAAEFIADFSNFGPQIGVTAPGVGCVSTIPGNRFGVMSGTSMASPVAAGAVACLLSSSPEVLAMSRDAARSQAIATLLSSNSSVRGFGPEFEGTGMPDPAKV